MSRSARLRLAALIPVAAFTAFTFGLPGPWLWSVHGHPALFGVAATLGIVHLIVCRQATRAVFTIAMLMASASRALSLIFQDRGFSGARTVSGVAAWVLIAYWALLNGRLRMSLEAHRALVAG
jgi:hypothetical protein